MFDQSWKWSTCSSKLAVEEPFVEAEESTSCSAIALSHTRGLYDGSVQRFYSPALQGKEDVPTERAGIFAVLVR